MGRVVPAMALVEGGVDRRRDVGGAAHHHRRAHPGSAPLRGRAPRAGPGGGAHRQRRLLLALATATVLALASCSSGSKSAQSTSSTAGSTAGSAAGTTDATTGTGDRLVVRGQATVDGSPFDAPYLGVVVRDGGLATACQADLPPVQGGRFEVGVYAEAESAGCGRPGAEIVLWTYVGDQRLFSSAAVPWPDGAGTATFDAAFSTAAPMGTIKSATELAGEVYDPDHHRLPPGARVEALVGDTLCGVSTTRQNGDFTGFTLSVVGPDSVPGCASNAPIAFRVDGRATDETLSNDGAVHRSFDLTLASP